MNDIRVEKISLGLNQSGSGNVAVYIHCIMYKRK